MSPFGVLNSRSCFQPFNRQRKRGIGEAVTGRAGTRIPVIVVVARPGFADDRLDLWLHRIEQGIVETFAEARFKCLPCEFGAALSLSGRRRVLRRVLVRLCHAASGRLCARDIPPACRQIFPLPAETLRCSIRAMRYLHALGLAAMMALPAAAKVTAAQAQTPPATTLADAHIATAKAAAQKDFTDLFDTTCGLVRPASLFSTAAAPPSVATDRATWHAEPVKVFDNLYFVGQSEFSAWAITTSQGIIVMDAIFDYSVDDEVVGGLTKLGLDPKQIKYVVVSHAHGDHVGGAKKLQDLGAKIVMSAADWELLEKATVNFPKPKRDMVVKDGDKLTLGDTTLTMYVTAGHTLGTLSTIFPVKDRGVTHMAAYWGGTAFNWVRGPANYITKDRPAGFWFDTYAKSAQHFRELASRASVDVLISNHTKYDQTPAKTAALATRGPRAIHPYVIGTAAVQRFLNVAEECARAGLAGSPLPK
ncbi:MAG: MBL fold metallo-hydrolase [Vicinamibacterales bacterium]